MMKKTKRFCAVGLAALMLMFWSTGTMVDAAEKIGCSHSWTAEERLGDAVTETRTHDTKDGLCVVKERAQYYRAVCRSCGTVVGTSRKVISEEHSVCSK